MDSPSVSLTSQFSARARRRRRGTNIYLNIQQQLQLLLWRCGARPVATAASSAAPKL